MDPLGVRLGYPDDATLLIVHCDDLGFCHAANVGVFDALRTGLATSASLMVPCPWARGAAAAYRGEDVGVHLTLNAEFDLYRWGPITHAPSLLDGDGGFPRTAADVWDHADVDEVRRECRAQIERAILWGFDVSHLDAHLGTLEARPEFFDVYLELAVEFRLPMALSAPGTEENLGFPFRELAAEEGVAFPDDVIHLPGAWARKTLFDALGHLSPGVTVVSLHPAVASAELEAMAPDWAERVDDHRLLVPDGELHEALADAGVTLIGYRPLRDLMRGVRPS
ncbi:MAG TPA: polysaccharide deacetylase family protein [Acidimicrobiales bacterium]|nr:polysaccharide deacetylase family protein [Acidimicrobiales bacterium]